MLSNSFGDESDIRVVKALFPTKPSGADSDATPGSQAEELVLSSAICWENLMVRLGSKQDSYN